MISEIKDQWVRALRSGEYKQGTGRLAYVSEEGQARYCCLGVLCELSPFEGESESALGEPGIEISWDGNFTSLPPVVRKWAGTDEQHADVLIALDDADIEMFTEKLGDNKFITDCEYWTGKEKATVLAALNDNGATFEDIAYVIEKYL